ncbi:MAG: hypothetical protein C5B55_12770 [Blastocatellia bacterium]|nr:MAG: hypothetical protein C5B55_12770 [Blastocatellia bacterium]
MRKKIIGAFILIASLTISEDLVLAQTPRRIQFAKGQSSAVVKGSTGTDGADFVVRAKSGQKLILKLAPTSGVGIKVESEGRYGHSVLLREEKGGIYEVGLEETGDYSIFIGSTGHKSVSFTLSIKITKMTDI